MTDDELIYATNETIDALQEYQKQILARHLGKVAKAYGDKLFQVERTAYAHGGIWLCGSMLKKDGTPSAGREYAVRIDEAEFV